MPTSRSKRGRGALRAAIACRAEALEARTLLAADFIGTEFNVTPGQGAGTVPTISVTFTVKNQNLVPFVHDAFQGYLVRIYPSSHNPIPSDREPVTSVTLPGLGAGQSETRTLSVEVNSFTSNLPKIPGT